jgi:hypothetical protein
MPPKPLLEHHDENDPAQVTPAAFAAFDFLTLPDGLIDCAFIVWERRSDRCRTFGADLAGTWSNESRYFFRSRLIELSHRPGRNGRAQGLTRAVCGQSIERPDLCPRRVCQGRAGAALSVYRQRQSAG